GGDQGARRGPPDRGASYRARKAQPASPRGRLAGRAQGVRGRSDRARETWSWWRVRAAQAFLGLVHELMGSLDVGSDELPVSLDHITADDPRLDVRGSGAEHHDRHRVAEPV